MGAKAALDARGLEPQKKWGQNFLTDARILESIADAAELQPDDAVLEIGPGLGHLTRVLARRAGRVVAVEIDRALAARLSAEFAAVPNVVIVHGDVLQREPIEWLWAGKEDPASSVRFKVVANLPYYITSAILRHLLQAAHKPHRIVVMVQREVAQRMTAQPPEMSVLAVSVQFYARARVVRTIPAGAFYPRPKVDSAVVRLEVSEGAPRAVENIERFFEIVRAGFGERRKQLRNALARGLSIDPGVIAAALARAQIDPARRAETLSLDEWGALYRALERV
ncbi:MAG: ribosomal RNA small subunit methyltransferase A [Chloroflexota bacterium]|nr:ribosomal RNA small subunit methyltransferase A [Chloroflexota bacterium]